MAIKGDPQERAFVFLLEKYNSQEAFTKKEFQAATGWGDVSFRAYWSKQFEGLVTSVGNKLRVHGVFARYTDWNKFHDNVVTQKRKLQKRYKTSLFEKVILFDFFMPLRNEEYLHTALDALFFKDSILFRLKALDEKELGRHFPRLLREKRKHYFERICEWISDKFVGYSIHHVSGRFRVGELKTRDEVYDKATRTPQRYLVDETTAVARFIIPCASAGSSEGHNSSEVSGEVPSQKSNTATEEEQIRWFFANLFVQRISEVVGGEDEIWVLESGLRNQLHIWRSAS
jgi:hypothetical protein